MGEEFVIIPSKESDYSEVANLSRGRSGRLFKKHLLNKGPLLHPNTGKTIMIDDQFIATLKRNFDNKVCDIVQVPLANDRNEHTEDPNRNIGEVVDLREENGKVYAIIDIRDENAAGKLGKTLLGASAMLHLNYKDTSTGEFVGPTLLHSCVTNRPYITNLDEYEEIVSASNSSDTHNGVVLTSPDDFEQNKEDNPVSDDNSPQSSPSFDENFWTRFKTELSQVFGKKENTSTDDEETSIDEPNEDAVVEIKLESNNDIEENEMAELTTEELISQLKEHGIDVAALQATAEGAQGTEQKLEEVTALSNTLSAEVKTANEKATAAEELAKKLSDELSSTGIIKLTNGEELSSEDVIGAVSELAQGHLALTNQVRDLREKDARNEVKTLVRAGRVMPAQEEAMVELKLSNPTMFDRLVPDSPIINMEDESGTEPEKGEKHANDVDAAIARFTASDGPLGRIAKTK